MWPEGWPPACGDPSGWAPLSIHCLCFLPATDCEGGQSLLPCGWACPRACQDLSPGSICQPGPAGCRPSCGCPPGQLSQDGLCVPPARCRCHYQPGAMGQCFPLSSPRDPPPPRHCSACLPGLCPWGPAWSGRMGTGRLSPAMLRAFISRTSHGVPGLPRVRASISQAQEHQGLKNDREGGRRQWARWRDSGWGAP